MGACLHKKYGGVVVVTLATSDKYIWCRNCGALVSQSGLQDVHPQSALEKVKKPRKQVETAEDLWD